MIKVCTSETVMMRSQLISVVLILGYNLAHTKSMGEEDGLCKLLPQESAGKKCCELPSVWTLSGEIKDITPEYIKCSKSAKQNMSLQNSGDYFKECVIQCLYNSTGFLTARMKLDENILDTAAKEIFGKDEKWKEVALVAIKECISSATKQVKDDSICKSGAMQFSICFVRELFLNCPADLWNDSENCVDEKMKLEKCPNIIPSSVTKFSFN